MTSRSARGRCGDDDEVRDWHVAGPNRQVRPGNSALRGHHRPVIVAMRAVRVVKVAVDQVVDVIAVRDRRMPATGAMHVVGGVSAAAMIRRARLRIVSGDVQRMLFDSSIGPGVVQVAIVEMVDVSLMFDSGMPAVRAVLMRVICVS